VLFWLDNVQLNRGKKREKNRLYPRHPGKRSLGQPWGGGAGVVTINSGSGLKILESGIGPNESFQGIVNQGDQATMKSLLIAITMLLMASVSHAAGKLNILFLFADDQRADTIAAHRKQSSREDRFN